MNELLIKKLKSLESIRPDAAFVSRTRNIVLERTQPTRVAFFRVQWVHRGIFSFAGAAVAILIGFLIFEPFGSSVTATSLENTQLSNEWSSLSINIQLKEVSYNNNAERIIASAINEIQDTNTRHLNASLIQEEREMLGTQEVKNNAIDDMLNQVLN
jgi:hypothetical protein